MGRNRAEGLRFRDFVGTVEAVRPIIRLGECVVRMWESVGVSTWLCEEGDKRRCKEG